MEHHQHQHQVPHLLPLQYVEVTSGAQYPVAGATHHPHPHSHPLPHPHPDLNYQQSEEGVGGVGVGGPAEKKGDKRCASCGLLGHERRSYTGCPNYKEREPNGEKSNKRAKHASNLDNNKEGDESEGVALSHLHHHSGMHQGANGDGTTTSSSSSSSLALPSLVDPSSSSSLNHPSELASSDGTLTLISPSKIKMQSEDGHNLISLGRKSRKCAVCWHLHKKRSRCDNKCEGCNVMMHVHCYVREHSVFVYAKRWGFPHKKEQ